jgi:hypothetical protein
LSGWIARDDRILHFKILVKSYRFFFRGHHGVLSRWVVEYHGLLHKVARYRVLSIWH